MKNIIVSDLFVKIYKNFNISSQINNMKRLNRKELMLLLILCIESYSDENNIVINNFLNYEKELNIIHDSFPNDGNIIDNDLLSIIKETNDKDINTSVIMDKYNNKMPYPLSDTEALIKRRDININKIMNFKNI